MDVQIRYDAVSRILFAGHFACYFIGQLHIGLDQIIIRLCLYAEPAVRSISYHMCKHIGKRILPCLFAIRIHHRLRQHLPIVGIDRPACVLGDQHLLPAVITVIDHRLLIGHCIIACIPHHRKKKRNKHAGNDPDLPTRLLSGSLPLSLHLLLHKKFPVFLPFPSSF